MVKRRQRDVYGNWVWTDDEEPENLQSNHSGKSGDGRTSSDSKSSDHRKRDDGEQIPLDWRDYIALTIASLETFLLPLVIFILILVGIVLVLAFFR